MVARLRDQRPTATALELDRIKRRAMAQASRGRSRQGKGMLMKSRLLTGLLVLGLMGSGGAAGVIANHNNGKGKDN